MNIKLVKNYNQIRPDRATLFCFPFAGGGASAYNSWVQKMKDKVTVCPIQLPGREERIMEKPYNNMTDMLDELEETIWKYIRGPYAFWGHSMGGKIAYELEKRLEKRGKTAQCFLVSGSRIPSIPEAFGGRKDREADEEAMKEWRKYTKRAFHCHMFEGGHFYIREQEEDVLSEVQKCLLGVPDEN